MIKQKLNSLTMLSDLDNMDRLDDNNPMSDSLQNILIEEEWTMKTPHKFLLNNIHPKMYQVVQG